MNRGGSPGGILRELFCIFAKATGTLDIALKYPYNEIRQTAIFLLPNRWICFGGML